MALWLWVPSPTRYRLASTRKKTCTTHPSIPSCKWGPGLGWGWTRLLAVPQSTQVQVGFWVATPCKVVTPAVLLRAPCPAIVQVLNSLEWRWGPWSYSYQGVGVTMIGSHLFICPFLHFLSSYCMCAVLLFLLVLLFPVLCYLCLFCLTSAVVVDLRASWGDSLCWRVYLCACHSHEGTINSPGVSSSSLLHVACTCCLLLYACC